MNRDRFIILEAYNVNIITKIKLSIDKNLVMLRVKIVCKFDLGEGAIIILSHGD